MEKQTNDLFHKYKNINIISPFKTLIKINKTLYGTFCKELLVHYMRLHQD